MTNPPATIDRDHPSVDEQRCKRDAVWDDPFAANRDQETPFLLVSLPAVRGNVEAIRAAFPNVEVWYALKCNSDPRIAATLARLGVGFEVASPHELRLILSLGVAADRIMCLHPIKAPAFVRQLHEAGVTRLAADSREEVEKIARFAPRSQIIVRVEVDGQGSRIPMNGKFGCSPEDTVELFQLARRRDVCPAGITIHVGSQCESLRTWAAALRTCEGVCERLAEDGSSVEIVSLGGGFPVRYTGDVPDLNSIGEVVRLASPHRFGAVGCRVTMEPGRAIVATAGTLVASVVGTATRGGVRWVYLDAGIHHGLFEWSPAKGGLTMPITVETEDRPLQTCRLAGPTCDSYDALPGLFDLPELRAGDRIAFHHAGAYTTSIATRFNGFDPPRTLIVGTEGAADG